MNKTKIRIVILGHIPHSLDLKKIQKWESTFFEILKPINTTNIVGDSDGKNWEYTDSNIENQIPQRNGEDLVLAITRVPLEDSYYTRRFTNNRVCLTYSEMAEILKYDNIPLENLILRILYTMTIVYKTYGNRIPINSESTNFAHDETRGCLFDMNGFKTDVIYSLNKPILCEHCIQNITNVPKFKIEKNIINKVQKEIKKIKKNRYYIITDFFKENPIISILLSSFFAITLGIIGSNIGRFVWEIWLKHYLQQGL